jgi:hypothetical protein
MAEIQDEQDLEPLPEPERDDEGDEATQVDPNDPAELLTSFEDELGNEDESGSELDAGVDVEEQEEGGFDGEPEPFDLGDVGSELIEFVQLDGEGDDVGFADDTGIEIGEAEPLGTDSGEEGGTEPGDLMSDLLGENLPSLDSADDGGDEGTNEPNEIDAIDDDPRLPPAELPWIEVALRASSPRSLVVQASERRFAAGDDLTLVDDSGNATVLVRKGGGAITSMVVDAENGFLVYATVGGRLFRTNFEGLPTRLIGWPEVAGFPTDRPFDVRLGGPTPSSRPAILLQIADGGGSLLESTDHGSTWRRVDLGGPVLSLASGTPPVALVRTSKGLALFRSEATGGFTAAALFSSDDPEGTTLSVAGTVIVALEPDLGVRVSADDGAVFRRVAGGRSATAVTAAMIAGRPSAFVALFDPTTVRASLACVDAGTGDSVTVADIESSDDDEFTRVLSLGWDPQTETLWAAGTFGLRCFRRPPSA